MLLNVIGIDSENLAGGLLSYKRDPEGRNLPLPLNQDSFLGDRQLQFLYFPGSSNFGVSSWLEDTLYSPLMPIYNE